MRVCIPAAAGFLESQCLIDATADQEAEIEEDETIEIVAAARSAEASKKGAGSEKGVMTGTRTGEVGIGTVTVEVVAATRGDVAAALQQAEVEEAEAAAVLVAAAEQQERPA